MPWVRGFQPVKSSYMRFIALVLTLVLILACSIILAQSAPNSSPQPQPKIVTVPLALDHNRVVINVEMSLPDGSTHRVRAWVDNGNPELCLSRRVALLLGLAITCSDKQCAAPPPSAITIGGMNVSLAVVHEARIPLKPVAAAAVMASGMNAEITIPSTILRNYDVLIDFPAHEFTIGQPGSLKFKG